MKEAIIQYEDTPSGGHLAISWKPLVRCKDCKHFRPENYVAPCKKVMRSEDADENWFCAEGEMRI